MSQQSTRKEVSDYYATFCAEESNLKLNIRHYQVFAHLLDAGLRKNDRVLEVGCGFGTITSLMAKYVKSGKITAVDISEERIASCKRQFQGRTNVEFLVSDMTDFSAAEKFDAVVFPDVLEHIPIEAHADLFKLISSLLKEDGKIIIHIPHPYSISYFRRTNPKVLQIIDQSIHTDLLVQSVYPAGLMIHSLRSYQLSNDQPDYQIIVLRKQKEYTALNPLPVNQIRKRKLGLRIRYWLATLF